MNALKFAVASFVMIGLTNVRAIADGESHHRPHYQHHEDYQRLPDPYAFQYEPRGYYPAYNSGYWRPADEVRQRNHAHYNEWINGNCYEQVPNYPRRKCHQNYDDHSLFHRWYY